MRFMSRLPPPQVSESSRTAGEQGQRARAVDRCCCSLPVIPTPVCNAAAAAAAAAAECWTVAERVVVMVVAAALLLLLVMLVVVLAA